RVRLACGLRIRARVWVYSGMLVLTDSALAPLCHLRHGRQPDRRGALELLAASHDGASEAIMRAHGFTVAQMVELVRAGLATATVRITEAGGRITAGGAAFGDLKPHLPLTSDLKGPVNSSSALESSMTCGLLYETRRGGPQHTT